jgi:response regulator RpfG family c-di-GMP phosphodiesterase/HD-like signal output (HDOD) protein
MNYKILIVDDEPANLRLLERLFRREFQVLSAISGAEALELLEKHDVAVIISDQRMPGMTGIEFLKHAAETRAHTVRIILTGYTDVNSLVEALNSGVVYKYVTKPWVNEDLRQTVVRAVEHYETIKSQFQYKLQNERLSEQLASANHGFIRFVAEVLDSKDTFLLRHLRRTSNYAVAIGHRLNLEDSELERLALAGFLYEIWRIIVSESNLQSIESPTIEGRRSGSRAAESAARLLMSFPGMEDIASAVRYHNQDFNGVSGENLSGERIPLFARIVAVAASYDKMTATQPVGERLTHEEAIGKLLSDSGKRFDPNIVKAFCEITAISRIKQVLGEGVIGMRLLRSRVSCDTGNLSTAGLLQKFKTTPMLAMDLLQVANIMDDRAPTAKLMAAMSKLGEEKLRSIIRQKGLPPTDDRTKNASERAVRRAVAAELLAAHTDIIHPEEAYTLGLLCDVGETMLLNLFPDEMHLLENHDEKTRKRRQVEIFGIDAAQISRRMLEVCGLPENLTTAIENRNDFMHANQPIALLLRVADVIANAPAVDQTSVSTVENSILEILNLSRADLNKTFERAHFISENRIESPENILEVVY